MKNKHAFTLIELLVVIAIIAILVAALSPALTSFMERGKATQCQNNLASIGKAITMYMNDSKDSLFSKESTGDSSWPKTLHRNYVKDWKTFRSPFDKPTQTRPIKEEGNIPISYGLSEKVYDTFAGTWKVSPSAVIMAAPAVKPSGKTNQVEFETDAIADTNVTIKGSGSTDAAFGTHGKRTKINVLYADGHVETMEWSKYADISTEKGKEHWDPMYEREEK
jgi:prepilin-type N-terminal cleavage/methylation domain-containing protein/prepilin-type processing-associated H-X9-DG protein